MSHATTREPGERGSPRTRVLDETHVLMLYAVAAVEHHRAASLLYPLPLHRIRRGVVARQRSTPPLALFPGHTHAHHGGGSRTRPTLEPGDPYGRQLAGSTSVADLTWERSPRAWDLAGAEIVQGQLRISTPDMAARSNKAQHQALQRHGRRGRLGVCHRS